MTATLLAIGDELLIGQVVNTNAAWLGQRLSDLGVPVRRELCVGDRDADIRAALDLALSDSDVVLVSGGLGPTHDDLTRDTVAAYFGVPLLHDPSVMAAIEERFARRGRTLPERNRVQAQVPEGFAVLPNAHGTAPGLMHTFERDGQPRWLVLMPGVPAELKHLFNTFVAPTIEAVPGREAIVHRTLLTAGVGESHLAEQVGDLTGWLDDRTTLAFLPSAGTVRMRISARGSDRAETEARAERFAAFLRERAGNAFYGEGEQTLEAAVGERLNAAGATVAVAESCTGGLLLDRLTDVPGSSAYVVGGVVAYCNRVKIGLLGVPEEVLETHGAVSEPVARAMAAGVRERLGATFGVATTGVAGPGGGTDEKPVGTVWIALATPNGTVAQCFRFVDDRRRNKTLTATTALDWLRRTVEKNTASAL